MSVKGELRKVLAPLARSIGLSGCHATSMTALKAFLAQCSPVNGGHPLRRVGGEVDGGYLIPDDFEGIAGLFSPGVSEVAEFELEFAKRGVPCFLADYSVQQAPVSHPLFRFEKAFLGASDGGMFMRLDSWVKRCASEKGDLLLQMDIEGAEYEVLLDTPDDVLQRFRIVVVEFHKLHGLLDEFGFQLISQAFGKLLRHFDVVHIHPNNCSKPVEFQGIAIPPVMEFTFLRKDRVGVRQPVTAFPHPLDRTNTLDRKDFPLPQCWYQSDAA